MNHPGIFISVNWMLSTFWGTFTDWLILNLEGSFLIIWSRQLSVPGCGIPHSNSHYRTWPYWSLYFKQQLLLMDSMFLCQIYYQWIQSICCMITCHSKWWGMWIDACMYTYWCVCLYTYICIKESGSGKEEGFQMERTHNEIRKFLQLS